MIVNNIYLKGAGTDIVLITGGLYRKGNMVYLLPLTTITLTTERQLVYPIPGIEADSAIIHLGNADVPGHALTISDEGIDISYIFDALPGHWQEAMIELPLAPTVPSEKIYPKAKFPWLPVGIVAATIASIAFLQRSK